MEIAYLATTHNMLWNCLNLSTRAGSNIHNCHSALCFHLCADRTPDNPLTETTKMAARHWSNASSRQDLEGQLLSGTIWLSFHEPDEGH